MAQERPVFKYAIDPESQHVVLFIPFETFIGKNNDFREHGIIIVPKDMAMIAEEIQDALLENLEKDENDPRISN